MKPYPFTPQSLQDQRDEILFRKIILSGLGVAFLYFSIMILRGI